ncbi:hypothetical protein FQN57_005364 [Myotisia sp. PD_48]|nr:hypothetical protein FQN57_005364 [Myotisia sp. PD_48]
MSSRNTSRSRSTSESHPERTSSRPSRPPMPNRTYSAPDGKLHRQNKSGGKHDAAEFSTIAENEASTGTERPYESLLDEVPASSPRLPQVNLAIIGARGVGKSTFVKFALDLKQTPIVRSSIKKMSMDGAIYVVRLLEIGIHNITLDERGSIVWPRFLGEQALPPIDGVLALFDSSDLRSVSHFPQVFGALRNSSNIPFILVACKSDCSSEDARHDPAAYEQACRILSGLKVQRISASLPESHKKCISAILKAIIMRSSDAATTPQNHPPPLAQHNRRTTTNSFVPRSNNPHNRQHTRASSENPRPTAGDTTLPDHSGGVNSDSTKNPNLAQHPQGSRYARSNSQPVPPRTPPGNRVNRGTTLMGESVPEDSSPGRSRYRRLRTTWRHSAGSDAFSSFLDMEDESEDSKPTGSPSSPNASKEKLEESGFPFEELVDRLLSVPLSKQDAKFPPIFLCLYRKFATPAQLLSAILTRFDLISSSTSPQLTRHADQLRFLNVLAQWVSEYPGDFAAPKTRRELTDFIAMLEKNLVFAFAAKEMNSFLEKFVDDDDLCWAYSDEVSDDTEADHVETFLDTSVQSSPSTFVASNADDAANNMSALDLSQESLDLSSQYSNLSTTSSFDRSGSISSQSFRTLLSIESAQREAQRLELIPRNLLTKVLWRMFMDIPDEDFAREVTRMDWIMYSSFRPRELIRHVSVSNSEKERLSVSLENVNRMIKSFNHLAFYVASIILLRDKAKHRAAALEKFMNISLKLRQLKNYNSLGAVIAGLNGTPVARLSQTRDLVSPAVQKQFMSLVILMGTQKSHFAYRLAWENSFNERIPFLPLHLRDLVSAEEGNKTLVGANNDRINWRKFEVMGEVVLGIQQSQKTPFPSYQRHEVAQRLILETKFGGDEDDLFTRSLQLEPSATGQVEAPRRRFAWRRN